MRISGKRSMAALARKAGALLRDRLGDNGSADLTAEQTAAAPSVLRRSELCLRDAASANPVHWPPLKLWPACARIPRACVVARPAHVAQAASVSPDAGGGAITFAAATSFVLGGETRHVEAVTLERGGKARLVGLEGFESEHEGPT